MKALFFDCDGVLAETERDGHRVAYNQAFAQLGLKDEWTPAGYGDLLAVAGGRERLEHYFDQVGWPEPAGERAALIAQIHEEKTRRFLQIVKSGALEPCAGVVSLVDEAQDMGIPVAICSTSHPASVRAVAVAVFGPERAERISVFAGDQVARKKPDPGIYLLAARELDVPPAQCLVIEDSAIGLRAALAAGMRCVITPSHYTQGDDFQGALERLPSLQGYALDVEACSIRWRAESQH